MASSYSFANTFKSYFTHTLYQEERNYIYSFLPSILLDHVTLKSDSLPKYQCLCKKLPFLWHHRLSSRYNYKLTENKTGHVTVWPMTNWPFDRLTIISLHTWKSYLFCTHGQLTNFLHTRPFFCTHGQLTIFCTHGQLHVHMFTIDDQKILCNSSLEALPPGDILDQ